jgi:hypothetical protein
MKAQGNIIRRMGYLRDQDGIMNRYLREKSNWDRHLTHTREFIKDSFRDPALKSVAVLGSGWLLDVPLEELCKRFEQVYLVDIHHPVQIRKKVEPMKEVKLIEMDLSGGAIEQLRKIVRKKAKLKGSELVEQLTLQPPLEHIGPDAVISVNLLNQLDIILCDYMSKHGYFQQEDPDLLRSALQKFHLQWITDTPGCLISDVEEISHDKKGNSTSKSLLFTTLPEGKRRDSWTWEFDTRGTYLTNSLTTMVVKAVEWA